MGEVDRSLGGGGGVSAGDDARGQTDGRTDCMMDTMHLHGNRENARIPLPSPGSIGERGSDREPCLAASSSARSADFTLSPPLSKRKGPLLLWAKNARDGWSDNPLVFAAVNIVHIS